MRGASSDRTRPPRLPRTRDRLRRAVLCGSIAASECQTAGRDVAVLAALTVVVGSRDGPPTGLSGQFLALGHLHDRRRLALRAGGRRAARRARRPRHLVAPQCLEPDDHPRAVQRHGPALAMWLAAQLFFVIIQRGPLGIPPAPSPAGSSSRSRCSRPPTSCSTPVSIAGAIAIGRPASLSRVWRQHFLPLGLTHFGGTSIAGLLLLLITAGLANLETLTIALPLIAVVLIAVLSECRVAARPQRAVRGAAIVRRRADGAPPMPCC